MHRSLSHLLALATLAAPLAARPQSAAPSAPLLVADVRLEQDPEAARVSLVVRDGRIERVLPAGAPPPPGCRRIEGDGALCLPAFVDAFTRAGCDTPVPVIDRDGGFDAQADVALGMREANRKGVQPAFRAVDALAFEDGALDGFRAHGFAVLHSGPDRELLAGQTTLVTTGGAALRDRVLRASVGQVGGLRARGAGYPTTLMGSMAQLRQFFLDAGLHARRAEAPDVGRRLPYDADLDAGAALLSGEQRVWARVDERGDIERWLGLAEEFGLRLVIVGGRDAWMLADRLKAAEVPVVLTLEWGDEPEDPAADEGAAEPDEDAIEAEEPEVPPEADAARDDAQGRDEPEPADPADPGGVDTQGDDATTDADDQASDEAGTEEASADDDAARWIYEEPRALRVERRRLWEERRDGALRLVEAGVPIAFGTAGGSSEDLMERVAALVEAGLDPAAARAALTSGAATLLGEEARLGRVAEGFEAQLALWTDAPWSEGAQLAWLVVDGETYEFEHATDEEDTAAAEVEASGEWRLRFAQNKRADATVTLVMAEDGSVSGTARYQAMRGQVVEIPVSGRVAGDQLKLSATTEVEGYPVDISVEARISGDTMSGKSVWKTAGGTETNDFEGTREPEGGAR